MSKEDLQKKLNETMLEYYTLLLREKREQEILRNEEERKFEKNRKDLEQMWRKFYNLKPKKIIDEITEIIKNNWDYYSRQGIRFGFGYVNDIYIKKYFLDMGIDIAQIFDRVRLSNLFEPLSYFDTYGIEEKIKWEKIFFEINNNFQELKEEELQKKTEEEDLERKKHFEKDVDKLFKKALEKNYHDVSQPHIKLLATELGIDTSGKLGLFTQSVSTKLREHWGMMNVPKRERELTKSIKIEIFKRDNYICQECGAGKEAILHVHHIIPHSKGGTDEMSNLITLCESCNKSIGDRVYNPLKEWKKRNRYP